MDGEDHVIAQTLDLVAKYGRWAHAIDSGEGQEAVEFAVDAAIDLAAMDPDTAHGVISGLLALLETYAPQVASLARIEHHERAVARLGD